MLTDRQREWATEQELWLAPVPRHITNVQMVGIARLRYRPKTRKTAAWWADLQAKGEGFLRRYEALVAPRTRGRSRSVAGCKIKGASRDFQGGIKAHQRTY